MFFASDGCLLSPSFLAISFCLRRPKANTHTHTHTSQILGISLLFLVPPFASWSGLLPGCFEGVGRRRGCRKALVFFVITHTHTHRHHRLVTPFLFMIYPPRASPSGNKLNAPAGGSVCVFSSKEGGGGGDYYVA